MVALERINACETVERKNNCKLNFFSMYFDRNNEEIHLSFKNSEKQQTQALTVPDSHDKDKDIVEVFVDFLSNHFDNPGVVNTKWSNRP